MNALDRMKKHLVPGKTYRRSELAAFSSNVDRNLHSLVKDGYLKKLSTGLYLAPKKTAFGDALPDENSLLEAFLNDDHFVVYSPSQFNSLGLGSTQLYNSRIVFNRKRTGELVVGGRTYTFKLWREAPKNLSEEFLVVELLNRINELAEDRETMLKLLRTKLPTFNRAKLNNAASRFGTLSAQKKLKTLLHEQQKA
jgi:hypothetical protein